MAEQDNGPDLTAEQWVRMYLTDSLITAAGEKATELAVEIAKVAPSLAEMVLNGQAGGEC